MREKMQQLGGFLAGMVIPNIAAILAWGLITALFIPTGWIPNETFAKLVGPMILYLLPLLIGYTGGKMVYGHRGGVVGAAAHPQLPTKLVSRARSPSSNCNPTDAAT